MITAVEYKLFRSESETIKLENKDGGIARCKQTW